MYWDRLGETATVWSGDINARYEGKFPSSNREMRKQTTRKNVTTLVARFALDTVYAVPVQSKILGGLQQKVHRSGIWMDD